MSHFQYCLNASTIRPTPLLEKIAIAGETGYSAIELWHDEIEAYLAAGGKLTAIRHALDDQGLQLPTTIYLRDWFDTPSAVFEKKAWPECRRRMEQAAELGAHYTIASPPAGQANYPLGAQRYRQLLELGDELGVWPSMEFLGFVDDLNTIEKALRVMNDAGHPRATTILDPFHVFRGGGSVESIALLREGQIAISHFNDIPSSPPREQQHDPDRVLPGDGSFDLRRYLALLRNTGYRRWLSLELFREDLWARDPREVARLGLEKMRAVAEQ
jgi:sugar phosphate isomerase/epimerase